MKVTRILAGVLALSFALGLSVLPAAASARSAAPIVYGTSQSAFKSMLSVIPKTYACREYVPASAGVPSTFPGIRVPAGVKTQVVSFRPNVTEFLSGALDAQVKHWLAQAPAGTMVTAYHEANWTDNYFRTHGGTPDQFVRIMHRLHWLAHLVNPKITVGEILLISPTVQARSPWVAKGLDWYGIDGYAGKVGTATPAQRLGPTVQSIRNVVPDAKLAVTETNAARRDTAGQIQWFKQMLAYAEAQHMIALLSWWGPPTNIPPFDPHGAYVPALRQIANQAAAY